jgi:hypothetical protein
MQLGDGAEIDGEYQFHVLALAQAEVGGLDENSGGTQVHRATQPPAASRKSDVNGGAGAMPGVQSTFQVPRLRVRFIAVVLRRLGSMPVQTLSSWVTQH